MTPEEKIQEELCEQFHFLQGKITIRRDKRIFTGALPREEFEAVIAYLHDRMGFYKAHHVVGVDDGEDLGFVYILSNAEGILLALKEKAPKADPRISSLSCLYPAVLLHERELVDLFGAQIEGLPEGLSYPLPDGWPEGNYPMRKEWNPKYFDRQTMTYHPPAEKPDGEDQK